MLAHRNTLRWFMLLALVTMVHSMPRIVYQRSQETNSYEPNHNPQHYQDERNDKSDVEDEDDYSSIDYYAPAKYSYKYGVSDFHTGDIKTHQESRDGDVVTGHYTVLEPDGYIRTVEYTSDKHNGFNAVIHKTLSKNQKQK